MIFTLMAALIPSVGLGLFSFWQHESLIAANVVHQLRTLASDTKRELERWLSERTQSVRALAASGAVIDGLSHRPVSAKAKSSQELTYYLNSVKDKLGTFLELTVLDPRGKVVASSSVAPASVVMPPDWFAKAASVVLVPPHWDERRATATLTVAVPVLSLDNRVLGALLAELDLGSVQSMLNFVASAIPGDAILLDKTGRAILSTYAELYQTIRIEPALLQQLRESKNELKQFEGIGRRTVLGLVDAPQDAPFIILVERDRAEVYQAWVIFRNLFLALVIGLALLVGLAALRIGRYIVLPLDRITVAADRISAGDLAVQLPKAQDDELGHLTQVFNRMSDKLRHVHREFERASLALQEQNALLETLSVTDSLTGLFNRMKLNEVLDEQFARFKRNQHTFAVLMLDIDHFKVLNDTFGHLAGDYVLTHVAEILKKSIRSVDYAARYGGEEFAIVLPETSSEAALDMAERIRSRIQMADYHFHGQHLAVTISVGVAHSRADDVTADAVISRADQMLYQAKYAGRNRVQIAKEVGRIGEPPDDGGDSLPGA